MKNMITNYTDIGEKHGAGGSQVVLKYSSELIQALYKNLSPAKSMF